MSDKDRVRNKHGCLAPPGFRVLSYVGYPQVAIGKDEVSTYKVALSVPSLEEYTFVMVHRSATLRAWFAFKLKAHDLRETHHLETKTPSWQRVWKLIQQNGEWMKLGARQGLSRYQWEIDEPTSILELFMYTLVVLCYRIERNTNDIEESTRGFRWHDYYCEAEGQFFLLYRFLLFHTRLFAPGRAISIHPPLSPASLQAWQQGYGYRIRKASESFMEYTNWDPLCMLGDSLRRREPREPPQSDADKIVTFILTGGDEAQIIRKDVKTIRRHIRSSLRGTLKYLLPVVDRMNIKSIVSKKPIKSLDEIWSSIESSDNPVFWLQPETENQRPPTSAIAKQTSQRNYSNHTVLKLEHMVDKLDDPDRARSAQSRFNLIKENHPHSADLVQESLFARKQMCEEATKDTTQFYKLRHLIADLSDAQQVHAQQYFTLITTNNPLASVAAENLIKLFTPDETEAEKLSNMMGIFNEIKRDTVESGGAMIQN